MNVSFPRDREDDPRRTAGQVQDHQNTQLVVQAATVAATDTCCDAKKCIQLGFSVSSSSRDVLGDVVMGEVPMPQEEVQPASSAC